ncbi:MAG: hypothetical protein KKB79_00305 [Nanoarchaeota archaeon]|nr:hypothetical protein [Nanoarchaeota archaeon]
MTSIGHVSYLDFRARLGLLAYSEESIEPNAFFVRGRGEKLLHFFTPLGVRYQLYVPERFVLGEFVRAGGNIEPVTNVFSRERMWFDDSSETLREYRKSVNEGQLVPEISLILPEINIKMLEERGREHADIEKKLIDSSRCVRIYALNR